MAFNLKHCILAVLLTTPTGLTECEFYFLYHRLVGVYLSPTLIRNIPVLFADICWKEPRYPDPDLLHPLPTSRTVQPL